MQQWVMSAVVLTVAVIFASGLSLLAEHSHRPGAKPGLLAIAGVVGIVAVAAARVIHRKSVFTPLLVLGVLPAALIGFFVLGR